MVGLWGHQGRCQSGQSPLGKVDEEEEKSEDLGIIAGSSGIMEKPGNSSVMTHWYPSIVPSEHVNTCIHSKMYMGCPQ